MNINSKIVWVLIITVWTTCLWLLCVKWCCMVICEAVVYSWKSAATDSLKSCILRNEQAPVAGFLCTAGMHCSSTFPAFQWMHVVPHIAPYSQWKKFTFFTDCLATTEFYCVLSIVLYKYWQQPWRNSPEVCRLLWYLRCNYSKLSMNQRWVVAPEPITCNLIHNQHAHVSI